MSTDIPGDGSTTTVLAIGSTLTSTSSDVLERDWFRVELIAGSAYVFTQTPTGPLPIQLTSLIVRDAAGRAVSHSMSTTYTPGVVQFVAPHTGTYFVDVGGGWPNIRVPNADHFYTLSAEASGLQFQRVTGTAGSDVLTVAPGQTLIGELNGLAGNDTLIAFDGWSVLQGGDGDDTLFSSPTGTSQLYGGNRADVLIGRGGSSVIFGGEGDDTYVITTFGQSVIETGTSTGDVLYTDVRYTLPDGIEIGVFSGTQSGLLRGNSQANILISSSGLQDLQGDDGDDVLYSAGNFTNLFGGAGNDIMVSGPGRDVMFDDFGDDTYIIEHTDVILEGASEYVGDRPPSTDIVYVLTGSYTLADRLEIGVAFGAVGLTGNALNNTLIGDGQDNLLSGAAGNDFVIGGAGNDTLYGGTGLDTLQGHVGADRFGFASVSELGDIIQDWVEADDAFVFTAAAFGFQPGQALVAGLNFFASNQPSPTGAGPSFLWDTDDTALYYDADGSGSGAAVLVADIQAFTNVTVGDFILI